MTEDQSYQSGFGNEFATQALTGALPVGCNNPQKAPYGLYAEQISGTAFTAPRGENQRSWLYKISPSARHTPYTEAQHPFITGNLTSSTVISPNQLRWDAPAEPKKTLDFVESLFPLCTTATTQSKSGSTIWLYNFNKAMTDSCFCNHDGDFLVVPQIGELEVFTEFGTLNAIPGEIVVIQRGIKFKVANKSGVTSRGYICENHGAHFSLPYRGPIGANGLANERDFLTPTAKYEDNATSHKQYAKYGEKLFVMELDRSPFDAVAWHGNYAPYKYDLRKFNTINTVSYDHPDPSIFTVLTSPSTQPGTANVDFVIFPSRWMVAENTFRPPYYHRNIMSEYMGLIYGVYDAKPAGGGFNPGGGSLHTCMSAHGPDAAAFESGSSEELAPKFQQETLAFMFESNLTYNPTSFALDASFLDQNYWKCWQSLRSNFKT
jgi:homogentisate 1,2-dioxygenase